MEVYNEINVVFILADTAFILQPMNQAAISIFTFDYLRNTFCKAITAQIVISLMDLGKVN